METNDIIDGVSIKLNELFKDFEIYTSKVKQSLKLPCFFIKTLPSSKQALIGNRYNNILNLVIHVMIEDNENKQEQLNNIADKLCELEYITLINQDILKGYDMKTEISDEVLLFSITYKFITYKKKIQEIEMNNLSVNEEVKDE